MTDRILALECLNQVGQTVTVMGWVNTLRNHGGINFIDLRDRSGLLQLVGGRELKTTHLEDVVSVTGQIVNRSPATVNPDLPTGQIELKVESLTILAQAKAVPFPIDTNGLEIDEEIRLKYRYLDLRRPRMAANLRLRSKVTHFIRDWLIKADFVEVETPILTKTTPEGARDFIVPARLQPGNFYALPQSPQQYKQLLMVAGLERYFQIARCFRDEDPRKDRAYGEFTQLDLEMSFITQEDILQLVESMFTQLITTLFPHKHISQSPWPRLTHHSVMDQYGTDKPDLRQDKQDPNELAFSWTLDFPLFTEQSETDFFYGSGKAKFAPSHHMFTAPHPDDLPLLDTNPAKVRGLQHDLVLNGFEVGGGSLRIHQAHVQAKVFDLIGFTTAQKAQFKHMLEAFSYGVPPHGGIAPGIDRLLMAILGEPSVREVIAFPTTASGKTAVVDAPSQASSEQLAELQIQVVKKTYATVFDQLIDLFKTNHIAYQLYEHAPVYTSSEAAKIRGDVSLHQGAKAMVLELNGKNLVLYVLPGDLRADLMALKTQLNVRRVAMAAKESILKQTGLEVGCIPPFGSLLNMPTYVDTRLSDCENIAFNAARHDCSVKMRYQDFLKLEKPVEIKLA